MSQRASEPIALDRPAALDTLRVGAKAARLAAARRAGIAVLDGVVVEADVSLPALAAATRLAAERSPAAARLALMDVDLPAGLVDAVARAVARERLVVRSSSPLEGVAGWSGAFSSYVGITPSELATAIRGCWASALGLDALERGGRLGTDPVAIGMAVLVQPAITPAPGGVAEVDGDLVRVTVADGELTGLLQGWAPGLVGEVAAAGTITGDAVERHGEALLVQVATLARACAEQLGDDHIEWALSDGVCYLLQCRRLERPPHAGPRRTARAGLTGEAVVRAARAVARFGGAAGDELVLPWFLAPGGRGSLHPSPGRLSAQSVRATAAALSAQAWDLPAEEAAAGAAEALTRLRDGLEPDALRTLSSLAPIDVGQGARLIGALEQAAASARPALFDPSDVWRLSPELLEQLMEGGPAAAQWQAGAAVPGAALWERFLCEAVLANGTLHRGEAASGELGAGRLLALEHPRRIRGARERWVLYVPSPLPGYAPLLWGASAVVSATGSPGAHLFDVARSLGLPAVAGVDLSAASRTEPGGAVVAVDGESGEVVVL